MQRKPLIERRTALADALIDAAVTTLGQGNDLPAAVSSWKPSRALRREPVWTVTRRNKGR